MTPAIVLAAGTSSRYPGRNKLLVPIDGLPVIVRVVAALRAAACPVVVVTGHQAMRVRVIVRTVFGHAAAIRFAHNRRYAEGMAGSLRVGIRALPNGATKAFLCLGDMPGIDGHLLHCLLRAWRPGLDVVRPVCRRRPGHPALVSARLFPAFKTLSGDRGAKAVLATVPVERRKHVPWHAGCLMDTDTPAALRYVQLQLARNRGSLCRQTIRLAGVSLWK